LASWNTGFQQIKVLFSQYPRILGELIIIALCTRIMTSFVIQLEAFFVL
jgi:hypothetical protein